jgi:hypothetical protein
MRGDWSAKESANMLRMLADAVDSMASELDAAPAEMIERKRRVKAALAELPGWQQEEIFRELQGPGPQERGRLPTDDDIPF